MTLIRKLHTLKFLVKYLTVSDGTEDGIIEFANIKAGVSNGNCKIKIKRITTIK